MFPKELQERRKIKICFLGLKPNPQRKQEKTISWTDGREQNVEEENKHVIRLYLPVSLN
jgi:hypothetical protein